MRHSPQSAKMQKLVASFHSSGQSQKAFAKSHGLTEGKLHYWIKKFSKGLPTSQEAGSPFIPIEVPGAEESLSRTILIRMPNGLEIQIPV